MILKSTLTVNILKLPVFLYYSQDLDHLQLLRTTLNQNVLLRFVQTVALNSLANCDT